ncbi:capsule assembly Wzi family protein [Roseivirga sp. BDSF3-8]|uniref:capsule assembly Wzi family protein n=1 Tax=Roseivirga sp. BDSF3-8 TaxID=3241598 RepID=UPI0035324069
MIRYLLLFVLLLQSAPFVQAQSTNAPLNPDYYHIIDRNVIKGGTLNVPFYTSVKAYQRQHIAGFAASYPDSSLHYDNRSRFNRAYLLQDNWEYTDTIHWQSEKPLWNTFFRSKSDLYSVRTKDFDLHLNPVLGLFAGRETGAEDLRFINTRGLQLRATIDERIGVYTFIGENQIRFPDFTRHYIRRQNVVPGEGFWKVYKDDTTAFDFITARGYLSLRVSDHVNLQFGQDRFFFGDGYRSLILSDFPKDYLFLKVQTNVWRINYTNLFAEMVARVPATFNGAKPNERYPKKYLAFHHLGVRLLENLQVGIFEAVMYGQEDDNGIELSYLNPIIFYRAIEQQNGSVDNAILGLDARWDIRKRYSLYGQLVIDEVVLDELRSGEGWWGNKFGVQAGLKYIDAFGIPHLDLQAEANLVRPYTYTHITDFTNYAHYRQPLAHPLGANFKEFVGIARYQPHERIWLTGRLLRATYGTDTTGVNYGGDVFKNYNTREQEYGNQIGQGISNTVTQAMLDARYMWKHNLFLEASYTLRRHESDLIASPQDTHFVQAGVRWNLPARQYDY